MTDIYLSRIRLSDFRTFGDFDVQIPAGPGLTLLVGTNGLGKSSFFDAVEWGLTGQVRRLARYLPAKADEATYLRRRGAASAHGVSLDFNNGQTVHRQGSERPDPASVVDLLKAPQWNASIEDIGVYLAFTHFLGQAEPQRFTSRDPGDQWKALKGPSGIDRLEDIRQGLRGRATSLAFTRRIGRETEAVQEAKRKLDEWRTLRERLRIARDTAGAAGGVDPDRLRAQISDLDDRIVIAFGASTELPAQESITAALARQLGDLQAEQGQIQQALRRLDDLSTTPQRYAAQIAAGAGDSAALVAARNRNDLAVQALGAAGPAAEAAIQATAVARQNLQLARQRSTDLVGLRASRSAFSVAAAELDRLKAARDKAKTDRSSIAPAMALVDAILNSTGERAATLSSTAAKLARAAEVLAKARRIPELDDQVQRARAESTTLAQAAAIARDALPGLLGRREQLTSDRALARSRLAAARTRATAFAAAIAQIAAHLHEEDADCPVCRSPVGTGTLLRAAQASAAAQSEDLANAEQIEAQFSTDLATLTTEIAAAETAIANSNLAKGALEAAMLALQAQTDLVRADLPDETVDLLAAAERAEQQAKLEFEAAMAAGAGDSAAAADAKARKATLTAQMADLDNRLAKLEIAISTAEARVGALADQLMATNEQGLSDSEFETHLAQAEAVAKQAQTALEEAERLETAAKAALAVGKAEAEAARQALAAAEAARGSAQALAAVLEASWTREGLSGVPDAAELERGRHALNARAAMVARFQDERAQLVAAHEITQSREALQALVLELESLGGEGASGDDDVYGTRLAAEVRVAEATLKSVETVNTVVKRFSETLRERAEAFSRDFLAPLNDLIGAYNEALLSTPGDSIAFRADSRVDRTSFEMSLNFRERWEDHLFNKDLPPQVVLSEGQMAANGFSILCAASTAYPWSRWRALMLDDPLQHNDIIHAAAFVDLMRNLVEIEKYQLVMSSHDRAEAEFIARKFDAAGLPCKLINLTAPSRAGVRYEEPPPNMPAQALLEATALSA